MPALLSKIQISDPFGAAQDPALPTVAAALDPEVLKPQFKRGLPRLSGPDGLVAVKSARVVRHKAGKRAVIEYDVRVEHAGQARSKAILIGKIRSRRFGNEACRLQEQIWNAGFASDSADGFSVPEPIGVLPDLRIWLQRKVRGVVAHQALAAPGGEAVARRIAGGIHKLHRAGVPTERQHLIADELRILDECLARVAAGRPDWAGRLRVLLAGCHRLASSLPAPRLCGIHRDFYPAQVIVEPGRLHLIDFDLYCQGDPALDAGNFLAHLMEESLRERGELTALAPVEQAFLERFLELSGPALAPSVEGYVTLTLVRHVYLSTLFPDRRAFTSAFLELCESRLRRAGCLARAEA